MSASKANPLRPGRSRPRRPHDSAALRLVEKAVLQADKVGVGQRGLHGRDEVRRLREDRDGHAASRQVAGTTRLSDDHPVAEEPVGEFDTALQVSDVWIRERSASIVEAIDSRPDSRIDPLIVDVFGVNREPLF